MIRVLDLQKSIDFYANAFDLDVRPGLKTYTTIQGPKGFVRLFSSIFQVRFRGKAAYAIFDMRKAGMTGEHQGHRLKTKCQSRK